MAVSGAAVSVIGWYAWAVLALAGKAGHFSPYVMTLVENSGTSE